MFDDLINKITHADYIDVITKIPDKSIDLILTDPPYGMTACIWDTKIDLPFMFKHFNRIIKKNGLIVVFASQPFTTDLINENRKYLKYCLYWEKNTGSNFLNCKYMPIRHIEDIVLFGKKRGVYNPQLSFNHLPTNSAKGRNTGNIYHGKMNVAYIGGNTSRLPKNILKFNTVSNYSRKHPSEKPIELISYLIKTYSNEKDIVADFFSGYGTTALSAIELNRNFIAVEKNKKHFKNSIERLNDYTSQGRLF